MSSSFDPKWYVMAAIGAACAAICRDVVPATRAPHAVAGGAEQIVPCVG
jgi:hypothetical protein